MNVKSVITKKQNINEAVNEIKDSIGDLKAKAILYFASSNYDHEKLSCALGEAFKNTTVFGCSTAGEIGCGQVMKNSIVAMAFDSNVIEDIKVEVVEDVRQEKDLKRAFKSFEDYFKTPMSELDFEKYVGIILIDGLCSYEEEIMDKIGNMTNIVFIGGSAGDDLKFKKTLVSANGKTYSNAAVLAVIKPTNGFDIIKTQSFKVLDKKLVANKVIPEKREVLEFNNKKAKIAYADALGIDSDKVAEYFMSNPVGLVCDEEIYVRSPQQVKDDKMVFYCNISEGMEVSLLESTDIIKDTKRAVEDKVKQLGNIKALINFHCILRTLEIEQKNQSEEYGRIFSDIPTIGFSSYGEQYVGHINQTSTILVLK
ncbi:MAG: FIST N-terminal domain-containing protein [Bacillota bacterium]|nr:FIST N-terminal domain-containing protein [Bacillota bacterium]